jgi:hypothetical protein
MVKGPLKTRRLGVFTQPGPKADVSRYQTEAVASVVPSRYFLHKVRVQTPEYCVPTTFMKPHVKTIAAVVPECQTCPHLRLAAAQRSA